MSPKGKPDPKPKDPSKKKTKAPKRVADTDISDAARVKVARVSIPWSEGDTKTENTSAVFNGRLSKRTVISEPNIFKKIEVRSHWYTPLPYYSSSAAKYIARYLNFSLNSFEL